MGNLGTYRTDVAMITDPQLRFLTSLTGELFDLSERITGTDQTAERAAAIEHLSALTKSSASDRISSLKGEILPTMRQTARQMSYSAPVERPASAPVELDTDGIYILDGTYVRIKRSGAGRLYALTLDTESRRWEYAPGTVGKVRPDMRITAADAAALPFSWCIRCGADLTAADSVERNMGPVCYRKSIG